MCALHAVGCAITRAWLVVHARPPCRQSRVVADVSTGPANTPAVNVIVEECDISGSFHLFQGQAEHLVLRNNRLWNGGMAFYLIARQAIIEGNDATGSSVIAMGGGCVSSTMRVWFDSRA